MDMSESERLFMKARHDEAQALHHARQEARQEGIQEGMQKGRDERSIEIARSLFQMGVPAEQILQITGLPQEELEKCK